MTTRRLHSVLAGRYVDYEMPEPAKPQPTIEEEIARREKVESELADMTRRADEASALAGKEGEARGAAESLLAQERLARASEAGVLAEVRGRVAELEARPVPEPRVLIEKVEIPTPVLQRDEELVSLVRELPSRLAPKPAGRLSFDVRRDPMGSISQVVATPEGA